MRNQPNRRNQFTLSRLLFSIASAWTLVCNGNVSALEQNVQPGSAALPPVPAAGLVVYKLHQQADDFAPCIEYANIKFFPLVANMTTLDGKFFSVQRGQIAYHIDYPSPNETLLEDSDQKRLEKFIAEYQRVSQRFKYAAPKLAPWIAKLRHDAAMMAQGFGRAEGRWVHRASYTYERDRLALREQLAIRKAQILGKKSPLTVDEVPMWTQAMDALEMAKQAEQRDLKRKKREAERIARADEFHRTKQTSRMKQGKLALPRGLDGSGGLDSSTKLDHTGPLVDR